MQAPKTVASGNKADNTARTPLCLAPKHATPNLHSSSGSFIREEITWFTVEPDTARPHADATGSCVMTQGFLTEAAPSHDAVKEWKNTGVQRVESARVAGQPSHGGGRTHQFSISTEPATHQSLSSALRLEVMTFQEGLSAFRIPLMIQNTHYQCSLWPKCSPWELLLFIFSKSKKLILGASQPFSLGG